MIESPLTRPIDPIDCGSVEQVLDRARKPITLIYGTIDFPTTFDHLDWLLPLDVQPIVMMYTALKFRNLSTFVVSLFPEHLRSCKICSYQRAVSYIMYQTRSSSWDFHLNPFCHHPHTNSFLILFRFYRIDIGEITMTRMLQNSVISE